MYDDFVCKNFFVLQADPLWEKASSTNAINEMFEFSQILLEFANANNINLLKDYAQKLLLAVKMFDIEKIPELIKRYPEIKKKVHELFLKN